MIPVRKIFKESVEHARIAAEKSGNSSFGGKILSLFDIYYCILRYGARPRDYTMFDFYDKNHRARNRYMTLGRYFKMVRKFDKETFRRISGNKVHEYEAFKNFIKRDWLYVDAGTDAEKILAFVNSHSSVIAKPNNGEQGRGVFKIEGTGDENLKKVLERGRNESFILEETLTNCREIAQINDTSLNTLRVVTSMGKNGKTKILAAILRVGRKGSLVDNWGGGGIGYFIDVNTGIIDRYGVDKKGETYMFHPDSGVQMIGYKIPHWEEVVDYTLRLAEIEPKAIFVGWDIALSTNGLDLVEMNFPGAHDMVQSFGFPIWNEVKSIL